MYKRTLECYLVFIARMKGSNQKMHTFVMGPVMVLI